MEEGSVIELCARIYNDVWEAARYAVATLLQSHPDGELPLLLCSSCCCFLIL